MRDCTRRRMVLIPFGQPKRFMSTHKLAHARQQMHGARTFREKAAHRHLLSGSHICESLSESFLYKMAEKMVGKGRLRRDPAKFKTALTPPAASRRGMTSMLALSRIDLMNDCRRRHRCPVYGNASFHTLFHATDSTEQTLGVWMRYAQTPDAR